MVKEVDASYRDALLREREGYARFGRDDRVAVVDAELKRLGVSRGSVHQGTERAVRSKPETRKK